MLDGLKTQQRWNKLLEPRYGVSLIVGLPFDDECCFGFEQVQRVLLSTSLAFEVVQTCTIHATVLRGKSASHPLELGWMRPSLVGERSLLREPFWLHWDRLSLCSDGAVRAYAVPDRPILSAMVADRLCTQLLSATGLEIAPQTEYWATIANVCPSRLSLGDGDLFNVAASCDDILRDSNLAKSLVSTIKLVYYHDLAFRSVQVLWEDSFND